MQIQGADCRVFTFKEGLLSRMAHDLQIRAESFDIDVGDAEIVGRFEARGLRVMAAMRDGRADERALSASDRAKIEETMRSDVLEVGRFSDITFRAARPKAWVDALDGALTLKGRARPLRVKLVREGERILATATIEQTDFGIKPYTAMLGTLRIQSRVEVRLTLPAANLAG